MPYDQPFEVTAFHSCDRELGMRLLNGSDELRPSHNPWDWLGPGIYFWEQNPSRALTYAEEAARQQQKFSGRIKTPFVIGAIIELGECLNLMEPIYDTVRSPFHEGAPIYEGANFTDRLHVEICVRNPAKIKGYFLPRPVERFNPYLDKAS